MSDQNNQDKPSLFDQFGAPEPEAEPAIDLNSDKKEELAELGDFLQPISPSSPAIKNIEPLFEDINSEEISDFSQLIGENTATEDASSVAEDDLQLSEENAAMTALFEESYDAGGEDPGEEPKTNSSIEDPNSPIPLIRAYASYDYSDDDLVEEFEAEANPKKSITLNRQVIILIAIVLLALGWLIYDNFIARDFSSKSKRERRRPERIEKSLFDSKKESVPLWDLSSQKGMETTANDELIHIAKMNSGRENPFAIPGVVADEIKNQIEKEIEEVAPPQLYQRRAYRAALVGVLTSSDRDLALINYKTANFEYLEGTSKDKIIKLATKSMNKSKDEVLELVRDDYIGPWHILKIETGTGLGREASITIEFDGDIRQMKVGQAIELGIFDSKDRLDIFKDAPEGKDNSAD